MNFRSATAPTSYVRVFDSAVEIVATLLFRGFFEFFFRPAVFDSTAIDLAIRQHRREQSILHM